MAAGWHAELLVLVFRKKYPTDAAVNCTHFLSIDIIINTEGELTL